MTLPKTAQKIEVNRATVDFFVYEENDHKVYAFDTSMYGPPEPMLNAMLGLELIENTQDVLVMYNHKPPMGLFPKIEGNFSYELFKEDGLAKVIFKYIHNSKAQTDFSSTHCDG